MGFQLVMTISIQCRRGTWPCYKMQSGN
ncbi:hypothetical protein NC651_000401 [Populus alba x Populus x berolinensis]|nr:hypothetical protein NC651_000401 [Populus alba x Populus x berolinensis]